MVEDYEELRKQALGTGAKNPGGLGLAVLMRHGMKSWMDAWPRRAPEVSVRPLAGSRPEEIISLDVRGEVVMILTGMALSARQEVRG